MEMATPFLTAYGAVLLAELAGDKLLYTTGVLATRYQTAPIIGGVSIACMCKMGLAVCLGGTIAQMPSTLIAVMTGASFCTVALMVVRQTAPPRNTQSREETPRAVMASFAATFFSEWGDLGQMTAAALALRFASPLEVWLGAVCALVTKAVLGALFGSRVRAWARGRSSPGVTRYSSAAIMLLLGVLSVIEVIDRKT
jgi:putative Ca2+/H+ antiporter (TMEM165/GDT1 family)